MNDATLERDIGRLVEGVEALRRDFERVENKSDAHRKAVYNRLTDNEKEILKRHAQYAASLAEIMMTQSNTEARISAMEPEIDSLRRMKQRGIGVLATVGLVCTMLGVTVAGGWEKILAGIRSLFG